MDEDHRAAKMHLEFDILKGIPLKAHVTDANKSEIAQLESMLALANCTAWTLDTESTTSLARFSNVPVHLLCDCIIMHPMSLSMNVP